VLPRARARGNDTSSGMATTNNGEAVAYPDMDEAVAYPDMDAKPVVPVNMAAVAVRQQLDVAAVHVTIPSRSSAGMMRTLTRASQSLAWPSTPRRPRPTS
jgi:hypothetical protein